MSGAGWGAGRERPDRPEGSGEGRMSANAGVMCGRSPPAYAVWNRNVGDGGIVPDLGRNMHRNAAPDSLPQAPPARSWPGLLPGAMRAAIWPALAIATLATCEAATGPKSGHV